MNELPHLATRMFNTPLIIHPAKTEVVLAALAERLGIVSLENFSPRGVPKIFRDDDDDDFSGRSRAKREKGYDIVPGTGIAVIEIKGTLVSKLGSLKPFSGLTGYNGLRQNVMMALNDAEVRGIMFDVHSPGGEVHGCFDLVDLIYNARGKKPMWSVLDQSAYSGAFALASATDKIIVPRTGGVGSIGVIVVHYDMSKAIEKAGGKVNVITYGDQKADGRPDIPLSKEARERVQADVDAMGELFVSTVARNLSITKQRVKNTQAGSFMGQQGVDAGLAHAVASPDQAFRDFVKFLDTKS